MDSLEIMSYRRFLVYKRYKMRNMQMKICYAFNLQVCFVYKKS